MYLCELLKDAIRTTNGTYVINDIDLHSDKCSIDISIFWNSPGYNVGYYPMIQIDDSKGNMILWKSGTEIPSDWYRWIEEILEDYLNIDDFCKMNDGGNYND